MTQKRKRGEDSELSVDSAIEAQLCVEVGPVSLGEREREGPGSHNDEQDGSVHAPCMGVEWMVIDTSPSSSPMDVTREVNVEGPAGKSMSHGTIGTSVVGTEDAAPGAPTVGMEDSFGPGAIDTSHFTGPRKSPELTVTRNPAPQCPLIWKVTPAESPSKRKRTRFLPKVSGAVTQIMHPGIVLIS